MSDNWKCCHLDLRRIAQALQAISEPNRLKILCLLRRGESCVCELQEALGLKHNLICHHLKALSRLGILKIRHQNQYTFYQLNARAYKKMLADINKLLGG